MVVVEDSIRRAKSIIMAPLPKRRHTIEVHINSITKLIKKLDNEGPATDEVLDLVRKLEDRLDLLDLQGTTDNQNNHSTGNGEKMVDLKIDRLMGDNWIMWKEQVIAKLTINKCVRAIEEKLDEKCDINRQAHAIIITSLSKKVYTLIKISPSAFELWNTLEKYFECNHTGHITELARKMCKAELDNYEKTEEHLEAMLSCYNSVNATKVILQSEFFAHMIFQSLKIPFNTPQVMAADREKLVDVDYVVRSLIAEAKSVLSKQETTTSIQLANVSRYASEKREKNFNKSDTDHEENENKYTKRCKFCKKRGHLVKDCFKVKNKDVTRGKPSFFATFSSCYNVCQYNADEDWIFDDGATGHYCGNVNLLQKVKKLNVPIEVRTASEILLATHEGIANIELEGGQIMIIKCWYVPGFKVNLISRSKLSETGFKTWFNTRKENWKIDNGEVMTTTKNVNGVQLIKTMRTIKHVANSSRNETINWHVRLGHISYKKLKNLSKYLPYVQCGKSSEICEICMTAKSKRNYYNKTKPSTRDVLGRIYSDISGPYDLDFEGNQYFITFIDEFSRNCSVFTFKSKFMVHELIKQYVNWAETQTGKRVKSFVSDNGREYVCAEVRNFFNSKGVEQIEIPPYSPQSNGVAERKNQSLCTMARCLIKEANLDSTTAKLIWSLVVKQANFILNRVPSSATNQIPLHVFYGKKKRVYLKHVKRFGSLVYVHNPQMPKLDSRATKMMLVGQCERGYLVFDLANTKVHLSRNVKILENVNYYDQKLNSDKNVSNTQTQEVNFSATYKKKEIEIDQQRVSDIEIPKNYDEALLTANKEDWQCAVLEEYQSLIDNDAYEEVEKCTQKTIDSRWVFTVKTNEYGVPTKFKARLVAKGYNQIHGIDYIESYAPVSDKTTVRVFFTIAAKKKQKVYHIDIVTAFLNGDLKEEVFVVPPNPFRNEGKIWKMKKALYGLKQAPKTWNDHFVDVLLKEDFTQSNVDSCLFIKGDIFALIYVDDILVTTATDQQFEGFKNMLIHRWKIHDLGPVRKFLGISVNIRGERFELNQKEYILTLAKKFGTTQCNPVSKPLSSGVEGLESNHKTCDKPIQQLIGSLLYVANSTRPDILASVSILARYTNKPSELLWRYTKQVLKYLQSTCDESLIISDSCPAPIQTFVDADFASDQISRKSQTGFIIKVFGSTVSWYSRKQPTVSASSTEAEYIALATASSHTVGIIQLLKDFSFHILEPVQIYEDNQPAIQIALGSSRIKHLNVKLHFIRNLIKRKKIELIKISTLSQIADCLTKTNPKISFTEIRKRLGLHAIRGSVKDGDSKEVQK